MYTDDEFATLVERETNKIELKSGASGKKLQEAFVAMSNTDGGTVFIGVTDERTVIGKRLDQGTDDAIHQAAQDARDLGPYTVREVKVGDRTVVAIDIEVRNDGDAERDVRLQLSAAASATRRKSWASTRHPTTVSMRRPRGRSNPHVGPCRCRSI